MRYLTLLLIGSTMAMPLKQGTSLGYLVNRPAEKDSTFTTLTLGAQSKTDSGDFWKVSIRDSSLSKQSIRTDTAVLRVKDGDTVWSKYSCLAAWDPAGRKVETVTWIRNSGTIPPFGAIAVVCADPTIGAGPYILTRTTRNFDIFQSANLPHVVSQSDTGIFLLSDEVSKESWTLTQFEGKQVDLTRIKRPQILAVLHEDETWIWTGSWPEGSGMFTTTVTSMLTWKVSATLPDSSNWLRRTFISLEISQATAPSGYTWDPDTIQTLFQFNINRSSGDRVIPVYDAITSSFAQCFVRYWLDVATGEGTWTRSDNHGTVSSTTSNEWKLQDKIGPTKISLGRRQYSLQFHDGVAFDSTTQSLSNGVKSPRNSSRIQGIAELKQELQAHPNAVVEIFDLQGHTARVSGKAALERMQLHVWTGIRYNGTTFTSSMF